MSHPIRLSSIPALGPHGFNKLAYVEWGDPQAEDVILCVHGLTRNSRDFDRVAQALAGRFRVASADMPGRGRSDWLPFKEDYNYPHYAAVSAALIARLGKDRIDWLGTSMGGLIGMLIASTPNSPIRRLILNDVGPFLPKASLERIGRYVGDDPRFTSLEEAASHLSMRYASFGVLPPEAWREMATHSTREAEGGGYLMHYDPGISKAFIGVEMQDIAMWPLWQMIKCPVLVLRGVDSDLLSTETTKQMAETGPRATVVEIPGCGHAPSLMTDDQIAIITDWLNKTPPA